jgi:hypothetical protein
MTRLLRPLWLLLALMLAQAPFVHAHAGTPVGRGWHLHLPRLDAATGPVLVAHDGATTELPTAWVAQRGSRDALRAWPAPTPAAGAQRAGAQRVVYASRSQRQPAGALRARRAGLPPPALAPPRSG